MTHPVLARLTSADPDERRAACVEAVDDPSAVLLIDALCAALADPEKRVAQAASDALARLAPVDPGVGAAVRAALRGGVASQRWFAAFTLSRIEAPSVRLLPPLVEALASDAGDIRWAAARLLVNTGRVHGEVLPLLIGLARSDPDPGVRAMALYGLRELAPDDGSCAQAIVDATRDADAAVRRAALTALASLHVVSEPVFRTLERVVDDASDPASQRIAAFALGALAGGPTALPDSAIASLRRQAEQSSDAGLRSAARRALEACSARV